MHEEMNEKQINLGRAERWLSGLGGAFLIRSGLRRRSLGGVMIAAGGAALIYRGATGFCQVYRRLGLDTAMPSQSRQIEVKVAITVARPPDEVFGFWRQLETLPQAAKHLESVTARGDGSSRWVAREGMLRLMWEAQSVEDRENRRITWRSLPGSRMYTEGDVQMNEAPAGRGTEIHVRFCFTPPGGIAGLAVSPVLRKMAQIQLSQELHRVKQQLETGEVATNAMRPDFETQERRRGEQEMRGQQQQGRQAMRGEREMRGQQQQARQAMRSQEQGRDMGRDISTPSEVGQVPTPATLGAEIPSAPRTDVQANVRPGDEVRR
jgi:uncharacterized membrane protein